MLPFQTFRYVFLFACAHTARFQGTFAVVRPEWTLLSQIHFVETKEIFVQQAPQSRIDFVVVEVVNGVHIAATIIDRTFELQTKPQYIVFNYVKLRVIQFDYFVIFIGSTDVFTQATCFKPAVCYTYISASFAVFLTSQKHVRSMCGCSSIKK